MASLRASAIVSAVVVWAFLATLVVARPGGRLCHSSFFVPDPNNARTVTLVGDVHGDPASFKLFSFVSNGFFGSPSSDFVQVRLLNLHRQMVFNYALSHSLDLAIHPDKPFVVDAAAQDEDHRKIVQTWSFSTSNPQHPITWVDVRSRHDLWRPDFSVPHEEQKPLNLDQSNGITLWWVFWISFAFGFTCALIWHFLRNCFLGSHEDGEVGFLYGYQELPSSEASEKDGAQKVFTEESAAKAEKV